MDIVSIMLAKGCFDPGVTCRMAPISTLWPVFAFIGIMIAWFAWEGRRIDRMQEEARRREREAGKGEDA